MKILYCGHDSLSSLLRIATLLFLAGGMSFGETPSPSAKDPYKILVNSDTTHILSCTSVWRPNREKLRADMFISTVDEVAAAGADALMMAPGLGWVPWWPSKVLPIEQHTAWFKEKFNTPKINTPFIDFVLAGNDMVQMTVDRCHEKGIACFISYRMNDVHGKDRAAAPGNGELATIPQFYIDHPEYLLGTQPNQMSWAKLLQNWAEPEVRNFKFQLIAELCRNYDLDGIELDFQRAPFYFRTNETTSQQRRRIMADFLAQVRQVLNETERNGRHRWLCVRIPSYSEVHDAMGIDIAAWADAGVDMFNLAPFYHTEQTTDLASLRKLAPQAAFYLEATHVIGFQGDTINRKNRRTTKEMFYTTANLAYAQGADGLSLFNFQYFRDYRDRNQDNSDGPYTEPPFEIIRELRDPAVVAARPQYYVQAEINGSEPRRKLPFPAKISEDAPRTFRLDLAAPQGGWKNHGKLRIQAKASLEQSSWKASINGKPLVLSVDVSEPYPTVYVQMQGKPEELRAWIVPPEVLHSGRNDIEITMKQGAPATLISLDLAMPNEPK